MRQMPRNIVIGQRVDSAKAQLAREMRRAPTPAERVVWNAVRANRLAGFHFRRQQVIAGFIVDFYCHAAALAVELDGDVHQQSRDYDAERDRALGALGIRVLRFSNDEAMGKLDEVLERVLAACPA